MPVALPAPVIRAVEPWRMKGLVSMDTSLGSLSQIPFLAPQWQGDANGDKHAAKHLVEALAELCEKRLDCG